MAESFPVPIMEALTMFKFDPSTVLSAMLAPALLMAATASLLISANNRLARVVDRLRQMLQIYEYDKTEHEYLGQVIQRQRRRSKMILYAVSFLYLSLAGFIGTSLTLSVYALANIHMGVLPVLLSIFGVTMMLLGVVTMWREVSIAVRTFEEEIDHEMQDQYSLPRPSGKTLP